MSCFNEWVASVKIAFSLRGLKAFQLMLSEPGYGTLKEMQDALKRIDEWLGCFYSCLHAHLFGLISNCSCGVRSASRASNQMRSRISSGPDAVGVAVFIDEAEQVFGSRRNMQNFHSVKAEVPWCLNLLGQVVWNSGVESWHTRQTGNLFFR